MEKKVWKGRRVGGVRAVSERVQAMSTYLTCKSYMCIVFTAKAQYSENVASVRHLGKISGSFPFFRSIIPMFPVHNPY